MAYQTMTSESRYRYDATRPYKPSYGFVHPHNPSQSSAGWLRLTHPSNLTVLGFSTPHAVHPPLDVGVYFGY